MAGRIEGSQEDEIEFMTSWLKDREESTKYEMNDMGMHKMAGMASPLQLKNLEMKKKFHRSCRYSKYSFYHFYLFYLVE